MTVAVGFSGVDCTDFGIPLVSSTPPPQYKPHTVVNGCKRRWRSWRMQIQHYPSKLVEGILATKNHNGEILNWFPCNCFIIICESSHLIPLFQKILLWFLSFGSFFYFQFHTLFIDFGYPSFPNQCSCTSAHCGLRDTMFQISR